MALEFSEAGYIEVYRGATLVSRHRQEREAMESVLRDSEASGGTDYEIRRPIIRVKARTTAPTGSIVGGGAVRP